MTQTDKIVLELISNALDTEYSINTGLFHNVNWAEVIDVATTQGVLGICFETIEQIDASYHPDLDNLMEWLGQVNHMEICNEAHQKLIEELASFYTRNGIKMSLLKGYGLSTYWPNPKHRPIGDIDIYLGHLWQFGDKMVQDRLGLDIESGHEHHTTFSYKGTLVENHYDFINTKAHRDAQMIEDKLKYLESCGFRKVHLGSDDSDIYLPSADFNAIFLIRHLGQHFAGEKVTLRQVLDWGLFLQKEATNINWREITPFLKEIGIWNFFNQINAVCEDYFGIKFNNAIPDIERDNDLENLIWEDILHPEFSEEKPKSLLPVLWFKLMRWYHNRWKHPLVYNEWWLPSFMTLLWSHVRRIKTIKD